LTKIAYLVHDLSDPAVTRRVKMMRAGGAEVIVVGFRRVDQPVLEVAGVKAIDLGRTYDARMGHRAWQAVRRCLQAGRLARLIGGCDVLMARNLEMLAIASAVRRKLKLRCRLVYESLDIHRLLLSPSLAGMVLRGIEKALLRQCSMLIVSSPAFLRAHFDAYKFAGRVLLLENKLLQISSVDADRKPHPLDREAPWKIGWFGMIRCAKSLDMLRSIATQSNGRVEVVIRGRPAYTEFDDFDQIIADAAGLSFLGGYRAEDLPELYQNVDFCWAIDYFEEGMNSQWLLPNRLYEGTFYGAVPFALASSETGRWLETHKIGLTLASPVDELAAFFEFLTSQNYNELNRAVLAVEKSELVVSGQECRDFVVAVSAGAC